MSGVSVSSEVMTAPLRVVVWGENRHEQVQPEIAERYPDGMHGAIQQGIQQNLGERAGRAHRHPRRPGARAHRGGAARDRRAGLVGSHGARRRLRRGRRARAPPRARGHGARRAALRALVEDLRQAHGHELHAALAHRPRPRGGLDGRPDASDRPGRAAPVRHRRAGDVRRVLRHPEARRADLHRRRSAAARSSGAASRSAAATAGSSTSAPATRTIRCTSTRTCAA